ncbi:kinesin-like protein KIN-5A isoform X2 [Phoenix dactylifera]|uniref:Kinesin-like protein KIN-5A isoform X2 n=1 Tax=Phoenix dactylifera TaxID=42345 RepID=A0A8B7BRB8_PHODC|nr:kinesin-like protein KIN-5A isoform X2 [Phoenix dactylifera]
MDSVQRKGSFVSMSPSHTPRSSDKYRSSDSNGNSNSKHDRDKGVNIQVLVRCRPLSEDEMRVSTPAVITCNEIRREVSATQNIANKQIDRTFVFDKVFGPDSRQKDLFDHAVVPIVNEVVEGYNCTIFAYGQTGTGKTYTMEGGGRKGKNGELTSDAGVIPRAVRQIFDVLEAQSAEYSMKVTFLELYNEEITDLLTPEESKFSDDKSKKPIALMEDGKGGVFVRGLEEEMVSSAGEIYKILDKGSARRRTAETLLNKQSSRSHSVFSITIHIKECTPEGEEMIKCGKLNLVDLAGSENISRSGAREGRAREAGEINKSLLTLGRVINTLVEHSGHIPYRDSKLTRLLRDSLGGKTKTCIIATISPSIHCLEETLNTLDYAYRAKNIKNKPEVNQKIMKSALIKDLYSEIDRLKQEVYAAREKNGVYIPRDRYLLEETEKKAMTEKLERMELDLESKDKQLVELHDLHNSQKVLSIELRDKLEKTERKLEDTEHALSDIEQRYRQAIFTIKEKEYLISNLLKSEKALVDRACDLRLELENAAADVSGLFSKIERKDKIEDANKNLVHQFHAHLTQQLDLLQRTVSDSVMQQENQLKEMEEGMQLFVSKKAEATRELQGCVGKLREMYGFGIRSLDDLAGELDENSQSTFGKLNSQVIAHSSALEDCFQGIALEADKLLNELQSSLFKQEEKLSVFAEQQREGLVRAVETTRSISNITTNFFLTLDVHASKLNKILEESQAVHDQKLFELEKKFEECAATEEKQLLEKVAEMLASSNTRKKKLVQEAIGGLCQSNCDRTNNLRKEMAMAHDFASSVKEQWMVYMEDTENHYLEDAASVESGRSVLEEGLHHCMSKARISSQQWRDAKHSLQSIGKTNVASIDSLVRSVMEANQLLRAKLSSTASTALQDVDVANKGLLSSIDGLLKLDHDAHESIDSLIIPCLGELRELTSGHHRKTLEITENAGRCLEEEYLVDEPTCSTPRIRVIGLPSVKSIEELRTPAFEELLMLFWEAKSDSKQINGDIKHFSEAHEFQSQAPRLPLTTIN